MLKVVTWNVNSINVRLERVLAFLERWKPDILMLQELKCPEEKFPFEAIRQAGYESAVLGQKTYNGVAIISKGPLEDIQVGMGPFYEDVAARVIRGKMGGITFLCCYVPNGQEVGSEKFQYKLNWFQGLQKLVESYQVNEQPLILGGDFNIAPDDRDVHDPKSWEGKILCSKVERDNFSNLLALGLSDVFRIHHEEGGIFSWWDYRAFGFQRNHGLRIDFVLASDFLAKLCTHTIIDREERKGERPSDHAPMIAEFNLPIK